MPGDETEGGVRVLCDGGSTATDIYSYDAFGSLQPSVSAGTTVNNIRFAGQQWDPDLNLYYNRARYLHPDSGRFTSRDTFEAEPGDIANLHRHLYCHSDPVNFSDPSGNVEFSIFSVTVGIENRILVIGGGVIAGAALYYRYIWDPTDRAMRAIPISQLKAELAREPERESRLQEIVGSSGQKTFRQAGLVAGGRMSVIINTEKGNPGRDMRNIWENLKNRAG